MPLNKTSFQVEEAWQGRLRLYALCAPQLEVSGWGNNAVMDVCGRKLLVAHKADTWMALTVTTEGTLDPKISRHYIRITPADPESSHPNENPNEGTLTIPNRHPEAQKSFPAKEIVDAGFLEVTEN